MVFPSRIVCVLISIALAGIVQQRADAQFTQQGGKLVGTGAETTFFVEQGYSVALSSNGNTALVGAPYDSGTAGAVWVFTRTAGVWSQQGAKLVGPRVASPAEQGYSVALSSDGNTALFGGREDNNGAGAAWVFTRTGSVWSLQTRLVGSAGGVIAGQGTSVSLSSDGNTALVGGPGDAGNIGAAWVFTRSGTVWSQQGSKLVGSGVAGIAAQGSSVSLSGDGNTALVGGDADSSRQGATWVFTRSGGVWTQQGSKLVGTGGVGSMVLQGFAVSLSSDGNTALICGRGDNTNGGAAWFFTRSNGVWSQQGGKLVGTGTPGNASQGWSASISGDGNTAVIGGPEDNSGFGAAWVFTRSGGVWSQLGSKLIGTGAVPGTPREGSGVAISSDGNTIMVGGDGDSTIMGAAWVFTRNGTAVGDQRAAVPLRFNLRQNYPDPFNPATVIEYSIPVGANGVTSLRVYDILGCEVAVLVNEQKAPGNYAVQFNASGFASGMYLYRLTVGSFVQSRKMLVVK